jgi:DNA-directed RNA polymerase specialized sigma24 family protein
MDLDHLLPAIQMRDTHAFATWMAGSELGVRDTLRSFASVIDVEAILQEALLRVWNVAPRFVPDGRPNGLLRLAVRIARNLAISEVRRTKAKPTADDDLEHALATLAERGPEPADPMLRQVIADCWEKLPNQPRAALDARMSSAGGSDDEALATSLSMRLNTFLQNFGRARKLLAECLQKNGVVVEEELGA